MEESDTYKILTPGVDRRGMLVCAQQLGRKQYRTDRNANS